MTLYNVICIYLFYYLLFLFIKYLFKAQLAIIKNEIFLTTNLSRNEHNRLVESAAQIINALNTDYGSSYPIFSSFYNNLSNNTVDFENGTLFSASTTQQSNNTPVSERLAQWVQETLSGILKLS